MFNALVRIQSERKIYPIHIVFSKNKGNFMTVKLVKLVTGEEVLAGFEVAGIGDAWVLDNPVRIMLNAQGVSMMPFSPFMKGDQLIINKLNVIYFVDVEEELANAYNSKFGSGILTASSLALG